MAAHKLLTFPPPAPGATSCTASGANWLTCTISGSTLTLGAATGQASHQVIGTCGSATSFGPCSLGIADLPGTLVTSASSLASTALMTGAGSQGAQTTTTRLSGGVFYPTTDGTTAIQLDKANGSTVVLNVDTTNGRVGIGTASPTSTLTVSGLSTFGSTTTTNNGTAGSAVCGQPIVGGLKMAYCYLNGYQQTGTAQTWTFPTPFNTTPVLLEGGGSCGTYNPSVTATVLTLPANASMALETCDVVIFGN
jgi:hypothetical protein